MRVAEVMTESIVVAAPAATVREVAELMRERGVGSVVLVEGERPVALVTDRDLALGVLPDGASAEGAARDHASAPVVTVPSDADVEGAAELMAQHGIRRLPVLDGDRLRGIVTLDDLAARAGEADLAAATTARVTRASLPGFYFHRRGEG